MQKTESIKINKNSPHKSQIKACRNETHLRLRRRRRRSFAGGSSRTRRAASTGFHRQIIAITTMLGKITNAIPKNTPTNVEHQPKTLELRKKLKWQKKKEK